MINQICIGKNCNFGRVNYNSNNRQVQFSNGSKSSGHQIIWVWNGVWKLNCIHNLVRLKGFQIPFINLDYLQHTLFPAIQNPVLCISTSECMLAHALAWSKTFENIQKSWKKSYMIISCSRWRWYFFHDFCMFLIAVRNTQHSRLVLISDTHHIQMVENSLIL